MAVILTTNHGKIKLELDAEKAPKTVENFLAYVTSGHYDGTIFHRVISGFMVQGGGFDTKYVQRPTRAPIPHEGREAIEKGGPRNVTGTIAMARTQDPNSASAQFFINVVDNQFLDPSTQSPGYVAFGKVISGMDVVNKIRTTPTGAGGPFRTDVPQTPVVIKSATLVK
jgi:peptidyl-prolyl cis-trans isomerase A (cyclophilin A)